MCASSSFNAFGVEPTRGMLRELSGIPPSRFYSVLEDLRQSGSIVCGRGALGTCRFVRCPVKSVSALSGRRGIKVTKRGFRLPGGSEEVFRGMTGVERDSLLRMVYDRIPESWDVAAFLDNVDPSLSYSENRKILDRLLPPRPATEAQLRSIEERERAGGGW